MRRLLDTLYAASALLAALAIIFIVLLIFVQVGGRTLGFGIRGVDDFVAWLTATACIAGTGYAFKTGSHVKVELITDRLSTGARHAVGVVACAIGLGIAAFGCYATAHMVFESYRFNDVSQGDFAVPLWIPQSGVAFGMFVLLVALVEEMFLILGGKHTRRDAGGDAAPVEI